MSNSDLGRRDFLAAGAAIGAMAAIPGQAMAQTQKKPPRLSVFALDIYSGKPAEGMRVDLSRLERNEYRSVKTVRINSTGNTDEPVFNAASMATGDYEFLLHFDDYFRDIKARLPAEPFLKKVPIRFTITDTAQVYHIPVLLTPWSYNAYRGS